MFDAYGQFQASTVAPSGSPRRHDPGVRAFVHGVTVFQSLYWRGQLRWAWGQLTRRSHRLLDLDDVRRYETVESMHEVGCQTVAVRQIRGSECRVCDFDDAFLPREPGMAQRWAGIYAARLSGVPMPAVSLIQVGAVYYVRDGHHRISVARMLGEEFIEAHVLVWEIIEQPAIVPALAPALSALMS